MNKIIIKNMKTVVKGFALLLLMGITFSSCSEEKFKGADQNGLPTVDGIDFELDVDDVLNQIHASVPSIPGCYPVWVINGATYSTLNDVDWGNPSAGTYPIELHMANRNGISQASVQKTFTFTKTLVDWTLYYSAMNNKTWRIDYSAKGHLGVGPAGSAGTEWWSANPDEKADWGVYDDRVTFTFAASGDDHGDYTYDPGEGGTVYVNTGATVLPGNTNDGQDYMSPVTKQEATFKIEPGTWKDAAGATQDGMFLVLPANTLFPYISGDTQYTNPRFRIESINGATISLVYDDGTGGSAWHFILTSTPDVPVVLPYDYDAAGNLWKTVDEAGPTMSFYYAPGWAPIANPEYTQAGNVYTFTYPEATSEAWQNQNNFVTTLTYTAGDKYDFGCIINPDKDITAATVKLVQDGDDGNFFFEYKTSLLGGFDNVIKLPAQVASGNMTAIKLVLDFGGNQANTVVTVKDIVFQPTVE